VTLDLDTKLEIEPVWLFVLFDQHCVPRRRSLNDLVGVIVIDVHVEAKRSELRHGMGNERTLSAGSAFHVHQIVSLRIR